MRPSHLLGKILRIRLPAEALQADTAVGVEFDPFFFEQLAHGMWIAPGPRARGFAVAVDHAVAGHVVAAHAGVERPADDARRAGCADGAGNPAVGGYPAARDARDNVEDAVVQGRRGYGEVRIHRGLRE